MVIEPVETPIHDTIYDDIIMSDEEIEADEYDSSLVDVCKHMYSNCTIIYVLNSTTTLLV